MAIFTRLYSWLLHEDAYNWQTLPQVEGELPAGDGQQVGEAGELGLHQGVGAPVHRHRPAAGGAAGHLVEVWM